MWGIWHMLFSEFSAGVSFPFQRSSSVIRSSVDALSTVFLAMSLEPLAVEAGWWRYRIELQDEKQDILLLVNYKILFLV